MTDTCLEEIYCSNIAKYQKQVTENLNLKSLLEVKAWPARDAIWVGLKYETQLFLQREILKRVYSVSDVRGGECDDEIAPTLNSFSIYSFYVFRAHDVPRKRVNKTIVWVHCAFYCPDVTQLLISFQVLIRSTHNDFMIRNKKHFVFRNLDPFRSLVNILCCIFNILEY